MELEMIIYAIVGLALLYLIIKLLKWPIKLLINGIVGVILYMLLILLENILIFILLLIL